MTSHDRVAAAAEAILAAIAHDSEVRRHVVSLFVWSRPGVDTAGQIEVAMTRFVSCLRAIFAGGLAYAVEDDRRALSEAIRRFYLEPQEAYTVHELATLWQIPVDDVRNILGDEIAAADDRESSCGDGVRIRWADALNMNDLFHIFRPVDVERALGKDFARARSARWRTVSLVVTLPQFVIDAIQHAPAIPSSAHLSAQIERMICDLAGSDYLIRT